MRKVLTVDDRTVEAEQSDLVGKWFVFLEGRTLTAMGEVVCEGPWHPDGMTFLLYDWHYYLEEYTVMRLVSLNALMKFAFFDTQDEAEEYVRGHADIVASS